MTPDRSSPTPVVDAVAGARPAVGAVLLALALAALGGAVYFGYRAAEARPPAEVTTPESPEAPPPATNPDNLRQYEFILAALSLAMIAVALGSPGIQAVAAVDKPTVEGRRRDARRLILFGGGMLGLVLMFAGGAFFVYHFGALVKWLSDGTPPKDAYKPVVALLAFVVGAGLAFLSVQPIRADERTDENSRRLVFGANVGVTALLLLAALVVFNIVVGLKVPNAIDTTATGIYTFDLSPATREFVAGLDTPVKFYTTLPDDPNPAMTPVIQDTRRLLTALREVNPARVSVEVLSPLVNADRIATLRSKFPDAKGFADFGVLVTVGADEKQYAAVTIDELFAPPSRGGAIQFTGEGRVLKELLFLADNKVRAAVYFTTGHGEIDVTEPTPGAETANRRPGTGLRAALTESNLDVKALAFDLAKPEVPAGAAVVVIADPRRAFQPAEVDALRAYMQPPRRGKLLVMTGPSPAVGTTAGVADTGLNPVLADLGVVPDDRYVLASPGSGMGYFDLMIVPTSAAEEAKAAFADALGERPAVFTRCRVLRTAAGSDPNVRAVPVLAAGADRRVTWFEPDLPADPGKTLGEFRTNAELVRAKGAAQGVIRVVAVTVLDGETPRAVVYGSGETFQDPARRGANPNAALFTQTVNYLRERPAAANIPAKTHGVYRMPRDPDLTKILVLPGLIGALGTVALGVGVFMLRRR